ncbi:hypothetical protein LINPERHAP2_LOCUS8865, partial [Linum perenne]
MEMAAASGHVEGAATEKGVAAGRRRWVAEERRFVGWQRGDGGWRRACWWWRRRLGSRAEREGRLPMVSRKETKWRWRRHLGTSREPRRRKGLLLAVGAGLRRSGGSSDGRGEMEAGGGRVGGGGGGWGPEQSARDDCRWFPGRLELAGDGWKRRNLAGDDRVDRRRRV